MAHKYMQAEDWAQIAHGVIESVLELQSIKDAEIGYLAADYSKKHGGMIVYAECIKVKDIYKPYCPHDILIVAYRDAEQMDEKQKRILMEHELMHIDVQDLDTDAPVYKIRPHDMQDFRRIIEKYGPGWADTRADE